MCQLRLICVSFYRRPPPVLFMAQFRGWNGHANVVQCNLPAHNPGEYARFGATGVTYGTYAESHHRCAGCAPTAWRDHPESTAGTIEGFVYWDASQFSHVPAGSCSGLAVTVAVGSSSGGPLVAYTPLATLTNNFKYVGQVKEFLAGGKVNVYDVCTYGYNHVPVGPDLQVKLEVTQPQVFSPAAVPQFATVGPVKIINAQCNMLPQITNPGLSDLLAHWGSCQNMAYDVNFAMHTAPRPQLGDASGGLTPANSGSQRECFPTRPSRGCWQVQHRQPYCSRQTEGSWGIGEQYPPPLLLQRRQKWN